MTHSSRAVRGEIEAGRRFCLYLPSFWEGLVQPVGLVYDTHKYILPNANDQHFTTFQAIS